MATATYAELRASARRVFLDESNTTAAERRRLADPKIVAAFNAGFDAAAELAADGASQIYGEFKHPYDPEKKR